MWFPKGRYRKPGSYIFDFVLGGRGDWIRKIWSDTVLLWYVVYEKVYDSAPNFVWIDLRVSWSWGILFYFLSTVFYLRGGFPQTTLLTGMLQDFFFWGLYDHRFLEVVAIFFCLGTAY